MVAIYPRAVSFLGVHHAAIERQDCDFRPGADWLIQCAKFRIPGITECQGKHGAPKKPPLISWFNIFLKQAFSHGQGFHHQE